MIAMKMERMGLYVPSCNGEKIASVSGDSMTPFKKWSVGASISSSFSSSNSKVTLGLLSDKILSRKENARA